ncbi:acetyl-CoA synthetase-like protein [Mytilinidion resinicola]|uniref:Acetyl-CoA synthetase-like protein n=1 Tax=Mytilinidion resinicola TaxID=574789 RepID=A0A6A6Z6X0_9PEZI|nr:acetyl-CoA synthetase-like protein [Mytilinidion resinicola]KAF2816413.1 acetyl-CoA synthetase-like protein [Mytilinidion resinicola]
MSHHFATRDEVEGLTMSTLPFFHGYGLLAPSDSLSIGKPFCIPPASSPPTGASTLALRQSTNAKVLMTVPSILEEMSTLPDDGGIRVLSKLHYVACGGGPLKPSTTKRLVDAGVRTVNAYGTTEAGSVNAMFIPSPEAAKSPEYFRIRDDIDVTFARTTLPNGEQRVKLSILPPVWTERFEVQDEFVCNPRCPEREFKPLGRIDNVIVLLNGEMVMPGILEAVLSERKDVAAAIVVGEGRDEVAVLVEPASALLPEEIEELKKALWPTMVRAGERMDGHARVTSIEILPPGKTFPRSDKGAVVRQETYQAFEEEIGLIYERLKGQNVDVDIDLNDGISFEENISRLIQDQGLEIAAKRIPADLIYSNPSISKIARHLRVGNYTTLPHENREATVQALIDKYSNPSRHPPPLPVLRRVICINRRSTEDPLERQKRSLHDKKIRLPPTAWRKIEVLETNTAAPGLGLAAKVYERLSNEVTYVVHNAWPMDFKRRVGSFEACASKTLRNSKFVFVSLIAVVGHYSAHHDDNGPVVPEVPMPNVACALETGYAEGKFVCEKIIERVAERRAGLFDAAIVRMGQKTGDREHGMWNKEEHFPALTASWLPIDLAAESLASLALTDSAQPGKKQLVYHHIENPIRQPWTEILKSISDHLGLSSALIPLQDWHERVQKVPDDDGQNPAKRLGDFFSADFPRMSGGGVILDASCTKEAVPAFNEIGGV